MLDMNIGNFVTVGIISIVAYAVTKAALKASGVTVDWL